MRTLPACIRRCKFLYMPVFVALFLIGAATLRANPARQESGNAQVAPPPELSSGTQISPAIFEKPIPSDQLLFLNKFSGSDSGDVIRDKQYRKLLKSLVPDCMYHYGHDMSLYDALDTVLHDSPLPVQIRDGRYMMISGRNGPYLDGRGFMWIDMQQGIGLGGFYFHPTNGEPTPTVAVFSRQLKDPSLTLSQLPAAFAEDLSRWTAQAHIALVTTRYFISGANERILLEHDEDYCAPPFSAYVSPRDDCLQLNADAADVDVNAAYYLVQIHYATNGTAWMIEGDDQIAWIRIRDNTCGIGPDPLGCHIRMTRERTNVIINRHPEPHPIHK